MTQSVWILLSHTETDSIRYGHAVNVYGTLSVKWDIRLEPNDRWDGHISVETLLVTTAAHGSKNSELHRIYAYNENQFRETMTRLGIAAVLPKHDRARVIGEAARAAVEEIIRTLEPDAGK